MVSMIATTLLLSLLLLINYDQVNAQNCVLREGEYLYDLSPLTITSGGAYGAEGKNGDGYYFFNICGEVNQGACSPHQSVCQIGDAPHGCGDARDVTLEPMEGNLGVKLKYKSGEPCYIMGGWLRYVTINVFCDPNATTLRVVEAREDPKCIYEIDTYSMHGCRKKTPLTPYPDVPVNIFLVVHSHDDVGWLKTMQGYYKYQVEDIINNIVRELQKNKTRKFIQVEQAFFVKWWERATPEARANVTKLVHDGQLKFPIGGWVMPDEATPSYSSLITQLTEGHQFLKRTFNYTPDVGWQIDPFGASHALAEIFKLSNFKGHVIDRIDWRVKNELSANKSLQFQWRVSNHTSDLLTHVLDTLYCIPFKKGMEYTHELNAEQVVTNAIYAVNVAKDKARWTRTPHVLVPVGCDFAYADPASAAHEYNALDKIIQYVTDHKKELNVIGIQYSTIDDYFDALHSSNTTFPVYSGDFFPFDDKDNSWWTGYYTSRPALKGLIRKSESILRASESLFSTVNMVSHYNDNATRSDVDNLLHAVSVNLHHDAITGTARPDVVRDYTEMLDTGLSKNYRAIESMLGMLTTKPMHTSDLSFDDSVSITNMVPVVVYNSLPWNRHDYVKLTIPKFEESLHFVVSCNGSSVPSQIISNFSGSGQAVLFFKVVLPPLGYQTYFVSPEKSGKDASFQRSSSIKNDFLQIDFSVNDSIVAVGSKRSNITLAQKFLVYQSYTGADQQSGAYIFRTDDLPPFELSPSSHADWSVGDFVSDVYQEFSYNESRGSLVTQHARIFHDTDEYLANFLEFSHTVNPLPRISHGRELAAKFETSIKNNRTCFTDSNGLRFLERTYNPDMFLPLAGNHYPTVYASHFSDPSTNNAIGFIWDRAHGFSCSYGNAEVMLHRRCLTDDARGLDGTPLDDDVAIDPVMRVVFGSTDEILKLIYRQMYLLNFRPIVTIGKADSEEAWKSLHSTEFSLLHRPLPANIHLVDLKSVESTSASTTTWQFILRLAHLFEYGEHKTLSGEVNLNMRDFLVEPYCITSLVETQLTANQVIQVIHVNRDAPPIITLLPKQMRTFLIDVEEDVNNCANHTCGAVGKCIDLKCAYTCECGLGAKFDPVAKTCVPSQADRPDSLFSVSSVLLLGVFAYLCIVCAYSIRRELRKMAEAGGRGPRGRKVHGKARRGWWGGFIRANRRVLQKILSPVLPSSTKRV